MSRRNHRRLLKGSGQNIVLDFIKACCDVETVADEAEQWLQALS
jgi:hypothetical protein